MVPLLYYYKNIQQWVTHKEYFFSSVLEGGKSKIKELTHSESNKIVLLLPEITEEKERPEYACFGHLLHYKISDPLNKWFCSWINHIRKTDGFLIL